MKTILEVCTLQDKTVFIRHLCMYWYEKAYHANTTKNEGCSNIIGLRRKKQTLIQIKKNST